MALPERFRMTEFFAPLPLAAVALMAVNDRFLKAWFHNAITVFVAQVAVAYGFRRLRATAATSMSGIRSGGAS